MARRAAPKTDPKLQQYAAKRDLTRSPEPPARTPRRTRQALSFVVHKHDATRLHYDLRLEWNGVLKSWAVTRGPSLDPGEKRLAVEVEDHPLAYGGFEGVIPSGYGAGTVMLWDRGTWVPLHPERVDQDLADGELKFVLAGEKLRGGYVLVRMRPRPQDRGRHNWLLIKERDSMAKPDDGEGILAADRSVLTGRSLDEISQTHAMPDFVAPQLCTPTGTPPSGPGWVHELKLDGYRMQLRVSGGTATWRTRTGLDWTKRFPALRREAGRLPDMLADGEIVALDDNGTPSFAALQATLAGEARHPMLFYAFDLLHDGTRDWRDQPLSARKARLRALLPENGETIRYLGDFTAPGAAILESACRLAMEGVISKQRDAPYTSGRGAAWTKAKCRNEEEFTVGGWTDSSTGHGIGALLVGHKDKGDFIYAGRVGSGIGAAASTRLLKLLKPLARPDPPFAGGRPPGATHAHWVNPSLTIQAAFANRTPSGVLRQASYRGIREDLPAPLPPSLGQGGAGGGSEPPGKAPKAPRAMALATPRPSRSTPRLTHPDRILWPATDSQPAITKADLAAFYTRYAARILEHAGGRPLSVIRAPDGIEGQRFFQRHAMPGMSDAIHTTPMPGQDKPFLRIDDEAGLLALAQMNVLELHPSGARADAPDRPDRLVFDLDPDPGVTAAQVREAALDLNERLTALGLTAFPRITGGKGLHLVVPIQPGPDWDMAKTFARALCTAMAQDAPDRFTITLAKKARKNRIFLDYLRNDLLSTAVAAWSPRARPGAPVATPVTWAQVRRGIAPDANRLPALLTGRRPADPWSGLAAASAPLEPAIRRLLAQRSPK